MALRALRMPGISKPLSASLRANGILCIPQVDQMMKLRVLIKRLKLSRFDFETYLLPTISGGSVFALPRSWYTNFDRNRLNWTQLADIIFWLGQGREQGAWCARKVSIDSKGI